MPYPYVVSRGSSSLKYFDHVKLVAVNLKVIILPEIAVAGTPLLSTLILAGIHNSPFTIGCPKQLHHVSRVQDCPSSH
jgi:hypothetical protein